ncbi:MAG: ribose 5-phosphate isomerase B [Desulfobacteraceae bacterium]|nr:ribose 5-phosphate isomerase B [Desulfobacteraceae bacterium]
MKIYIGADHAGWKLKDAIVEAVKASGHEVADLGTNGPESVDYPLVAFKVARAVSAGKGERGILVCGSGIGMCMCANRVRGVRAVMGVEPFSAVMSRRHNDSNVLCLGERMTGRDLALDIVAKWLETGFEGGRHKRRVDLIDSLSTGEE